MKTTLERLDDTTVKLEIEIEPERVKAAFDEAARHLAQGVQIAGFRKGKVPRKVLESRIGKGAIAQHAIEDSLGAFYAEAVESEELQPVAQPEIDLERFDEKEGCAFTATVEVRPEFELPDHEGINVSFPDWDVTEDDVQEQLDEMRERFAELDEVDRPARIGDYVTIDLEVAREGEPIEEATAEDALYEVGSGGVTPRLDEELAGAVAGQTLVYTDEMPENYPEHGGKKAEFTAHVKDVRAKLLPDLDDEFAQTASEFETIEELEDSVYHSLARQRLENARHLLRARVVEAYLARVDVPLPEAMVDNEAENRFDQVRQQAEQYGMDVGELLAMQDTSEEEYRATAAEQAREAVKAQLVLEALAQKVGVEVEPGDLEQEIRRHASRHNVSPNEIAKVVNEQGSVGVLVGDVVRRKAIDLLVESAGIENRPSDEQWTEAGLTPLGQTAQTAAPEDPGAGTEPHEPDLGGEPDPSEIAEAAEDAGETVAEQNVEDAGRPAAAGETEDDTEDVGQTAPVEPDEDEAS